MIGYLLLAVAVALVLWGVAIYNGLVRRKTVVGTVMSNLGLELALKAKGIRLLRTDVGDRYVVEAMLKGGYVLGGEQSGHVIFLNHTTTGDGILTALRLLAEFAAGYQLDLGHEFPEMFCCWNTGRPYGRTYDPHYVARGLARMELYRRQAARAAPPPSPGAAGARP